MGDSCRRLGIPLVFTGHSLGRESCAARGGGEYIEQAFSISRRIDAEELALAHADLVITSTRQEADEQYSRYGRFQADRAQVVPPGVDASRFHPKGSATETQEIDGLLSPFLRNPELPPLLAISRAVRRKNIPALVEAFGRSAVLRERHNLVLVLGCREDPRQLEKQQREVFQQVFDLVDRYDLYGQVAYPKQHRRDQIPAVYRWAAKRHGLFVTPALTEPFGLTLLEAAACGLPMVATDDGGLCLMSRDLAGRSGRRDVVGSLEDNGIEAVSPLQLGCPPYLVLMQQNLEVRRQPPPGSTSGCLSPSRSVAVAGSSGLVPENLVALREQLQRDAHGSAQCAGHHHRSIPAAARQRFAGYLPDPGVWITRAGTEIVYGRARSRIPVGRARCHRLEPQPGGAGLEDLGAHLKLQTSCIRSLQSVSGEAILPLASAASTARPCSCHWFLMYLGHHAASHPLPLPG